MPLAGITINAWSGSLSLIKIPGIWARRVRSQAILA